MNALDYVSVEAAAGLPGLRVAFSRGVPGPWGFGARAILEYKAIPFVATPQIPGEPNAALQRWTGQTSAPVAVLNDERPRASWWEIILLAERLAPERPLIPKAEDDRAMMFGLCHELCAEDGLGWSLRMMMFGLREPQGDPKAAVLTRKYNSGEGFEHSRTRVNAVVDLLARRLAAQAARGSAFLVGDVLSAADFYFAGFSNFLRGLPQDVCLMPAYYRVLCDDVLPHLRPVPEILFEHRDRIVRRYLTIPMSF